jgi:hypothetical protein
MWVDHDAKAADSADMVHVFDMMGKLRQCEGPLTHEVPHVIAYLD